MLASVSQRWHLTCNQARLKPGETLPRYDKLEFKLIDGHIVCEGVVVDPPMGRK